MTIHTDVRGRYPGVAALLRSRMAVQTLHLQFASVQAVGKGYRLCWFIADLMTRQCVRVELGQQDQQAEPQCGQKHQGYEWAAEVLQYPRRLWTWPCHPVSPSHCSVCAATPAGSQSHTNAPTEVCATGRATAPPGHAPDA